MSGDLAPIELVAAGVYDVPDTPFEIVKTEWTGPRGGKLGLWEIVETRANGERVIENRISPGNTLREARENLAGAH